MTVAALGAAGIAAGAVLGSGAALGTSSAGGTTATTNLQPAFNRIGGYGVGGNGDDSSATGTTSSSGTTATTAQQAGVVDITSTLGYRSAESAGTGMVLTSTGEVLTNNHVIAGATSITVTVVSSGTIYPATVVGTDPTADVAVLQLAGATGLATATLSTTPATVGETVTAVGNAGGTGTLTAAGGTVTALDRSITATDSSGSDAEQLSGLLETDAGVQPGDSGGPLYDAAGAVVGMDTAASSGGVAEAYAIPIAAAAKIAAEIEQGVSSGTIQQGYPAFIGVSVGDGSGGVSVLGVLAGGPAASAGMTAGDLVTAVGGRSVASAADLGAALAGYSPGQRVSVSWTDAAGVGHSATVTLATGPAR
jgi:S1-C subfamily serine protease